MTSVCLPDVEYDKVQSEMPRLCEKCLSEIENGRCKACRKTWRLRWTRTPDQLLKKNLRDIAYQASHRDEINARSKEYKKTWKPMNTAKLRGYEKKWRSKNPDKVKKHRQNYYFSHLEQRKELVRGWLERHPFQARVYRNRYRARMANSRGDHTAAEVRAVLAKFHGKCAVCGSADRIEIDHHVAVSKGGCNFAFNLRPLCFKHNREKNASLDGVSQFSLFDNVDTSA